MDGSTVQACFVGNVVGSKVAALVTDWEGPGAERLSDKIKHVLGVGVFGKCLIVQGIDACPPLLDSPLLDPAFGFTSY